MSSTYTTNNGIEKPNSGEQSGTWGITADNNYDLIDEALDGVAFITLTGPTYNLNFTDGSSCNARHRILVFNGSPGAPVTVSISADQRNPALPQKFYIVVNQTTTSQDIVFQCSAGRNYTLTSLRESMLIYCDGLGNVYPVPSVSNTPVTVDMTGTSTTTLSDGQTVLILTGTPTGSPAKLTISPVAPTSIFVANLTNTIVTLASGTGARTFTLAPGGSSPVYIDGQNSLYGTASGLPIQKVNVNSVAVTANVTTGLQLLVLTGNPFTPATVALTPVTVSGLIMVSNTTPFLVTLTCSPSAGNTIQVAPGNTVFAVLDGFGNVLNPFANYGSQLVLRDLFAQTLNVAGAGTVTGTLTVGGKLTANSQLAAASAAFTGDTTIGGSASVGGAATIGSNCTVSGLLTVGAGVSSQGGVTAPAFFSPGNISSDSVNTNQLTVTTANVVGFGSGPQQYTPTILVTGATTTINAGGTNTWYMTLGQLAFVSITAGITTTVVTNSVTLSVPLAWNWYGHFTGETQAAGMNGGNWTSMACYSNGGTNLVVVPVNGIQFPANTTISIRIHGFYYHA